MKMKRNIKSCCQRIQWMMLALLTLCFTGCKDDDGATGNFDPDKPVVISEFSPKEGGLGTRLLLYGENFGNDISKIKITIGGKDAKVIGAKGESLYCVVPAKAYDGDIKLSVINDEGEEIATTEASEKFTYQKKMLVTTFLGTMYDGNTKFDLKDGPFNDCGGFGGSVWLSFDPKNHNHLYLVGEQHPTRLIDFEKNM